MPPSTSARMADTTIFRRDTLGGTRDACAPQTPGSGLGRQVVPASFAFRTLHSAFLFCLPFGHDRASSGPDRMTSGPDQSSIGLDHFSSGRDQFSTGRGNFSSGPDQFLIGLDHFSSGHDQFSIGRDILIRPRPILNWSNHFSSGRDQFSIGLGKFSSGRGRISTGCGLAGPDHQRL